MLKKSRNPMPPEEEDHLVDAVLVRNLATHGLTVEEMKRIMEEIRARWWKRGYDRVEKDLR